MEQVLDRLDSVGAEVVDPPAGALVGPTVMGMVDALGAPHPHRVAVDDGHRQLSPFLLGVTVRRLARAILDRAPPGPVGVALREGGMGIVATLAALAAGRDCVLLDPDRLPGAARGCACLVQDPREAAAAPPGCVGIDVFLSCGAPYAESGPPLPEAATADAAVRFGGVDGEAVTFERLASGARGIAAPHPPVSGLLSCPRCLGGALAALASGRAVRIEAGAGCGTAAGIGSGR